MVAAHPRSRGEHIGRSDLDTVIDGSSPLARGTWFQSTGSTHAFRLIPARAGNMSPPRSQPYRPAAHPRSRGEHFVVFAVACGCFGSSPLARGTLAFFIRHITHTRLIPARAGNIAIMTSTSTPAAAHPRSRGEHANSLFIFPPPARLIPARAGNILRGLLGHYRVPAHPRSRGEHNECSVFTGRANGSSPLARGTSPSVVELGGAFRLIPARAGNIPKPDPWAQRNAAHPRSRGEHLIHNEDGKPAVGSSPLARGTCGNVSKGRGCLRLIPARAGNIFYSV